MLERDKTETVRAHWHRDGVVPGTGCAAATASDKAHRRCSAGPVYDLYCACWAKCYDRGRPCCSTEGYIEPDAKKQC